MASRRQPTSKRQKTPATGVMASPAMEANEPSPSDPEGTPRMIVAVGASAGGLEAFAQLLRHLPSDTGMGFLLVQHLDPDHESILVQLLSRDTRLPVHQITDNQRVRANQVYVIPPDTNLTIVQGVLKLTPRARMHTLHRPIDILFESLAHDQKNLAVGIVLSGTATDGTVGLEAIKAEGGITFAQDDSAKHSSMPRSAVAAGCVDFVLPPADIAKELGRIARHPSFTRSPRSLSIHARADGEAAREDEDTPSRPPEARSHTHGARDADEGYRTILELLRDHSGVDFSLYKAATIHRRIARRLVLSKQNRMEEYGRYLRGNAKELAALYSDVLISVTSFFRNPEVFEALQREIFPQLLRQPGDEALRLWVLGCSTGQEAYSLVIAFLETAGQMASRRKFQVFATDLNDAVLEKARHGLYAKNLVADLSPQRLQRYFVEENGGYRISKMVRDMVVFARQNLIDDPPFSRMDLISCRNLLIYLEPSIQQKALPTFHYALKPEGFLVLGASESIGDFTDLFEPVNKKHQLYSRKDASSSAGHFPRRKEWRAQPFHDVPLPAQREGTASEGFRRELNAQREADRITINQFAPPGVLVSADLQVLQFRGSTGAYLAPPAGRASFDLLKMAREGLMLTLRSAIREAKKHNTTVRRDHVRIKHDGESRLVNVEVIPLKNIREGCFLILFTGPERALPSSLPSKKLRVAGKTGSPSEVQKNLAQVADTERELAETRDYLQSIQEQHAATTEELQSLHEEAQSANEELHSTNEELQTSKEELESTNEELSTVNEEMTNRNTELTRLYTDVVNLQMSTKLPILLLDRALAIRRFSPQAEKQFDLVAADLGRPIAHLRHKLVSVNDELATLDLESVSAAVLSSGREQEREVRDDRGQWHSLRVGPYWGLDNKVEGVVVVLLDISDLKRGDFAEATVRTARDPLLVLGADLRVNTANEAFYKTFNTVPEQTLGRAMFDLCEGAWSSPKLRMFLEGILPRKSCFNDFEVTHIFPQIGQRTMLLNARPLDHPANEPTMILIVIEDVTERRESLEALRQSEIRFRSLFEAAHDGIVILDSVSRKITDANPFIVELLGCAREDLVGRELWDIGLLADEQASHVLFRELREKGQSSSTEVRLKTQLGQERDVEFRCNIYEEAGHQVIQCNIRDITDRKRMEETRRQNEALFATLVDQAPNGMYIVDAHFRVQQVNARAQPVFAAVHPLIGRDFSDVMQILWGPEVGKRIATIFRHTLESGEGYISPSFTHQRADLGTEQSYEWETRRVTLPGGVHAVVCYFTDVTELKRSEETKDRLAAIIESSGDAVLSENKSGIITSWNWGAERLFGYTAGEMLGQPLMTLIPPERIHEESATLERIRHGQALATYETVRRRKDGSRVDVALTISPLREGERQIGSSSIARDITDRKRADEDLEQRVVARTQELVKAHERERILVKDLNLTEQRERTRLATELHDYLGQLLVLGKMKISQSRLHAPTTEKREALIEETDTVLSDALTYTRTLVVDLCPPILQESGLPAALRWLSERMQRYELSVTVQSDSDDVKLPKDRALLLFQSVRELLMNVVKHAGTDTATVRMEQESGSLCVEVQDLGVGFNLPTPGDHGDNPVSSSKFGLFSIRERMDAIGGRFEIHSAPGAGTTTTLILPLEGTEDSGSNLMRPAQTDIRQSSIIIALSSNNAASENIQHNPPSAIKTQSEPPVSHPDQRSQSIRVLLVDDHAMIREGLRSVLESYPDVVVVGEASNGEEAVGAVEVLQPSHVVMDINMPRMNGIQATGRIKSHYPHIIVIGLSVHANAGTSEALVRAGGAILLDKADAAGALYQAIRQTLK